MPLQILTSDTFDVLWIGAKQIHSLSNAAVARYIPDETLYAYSLDAYNEFIEEKSTSSPSIYLRSTPSQSASTYLGSTPVRATSTSMNSSETLHEEQSQYAEEVKREKAEPVTLKIEHDLATVERKDIEKVKAKKPATKGKAKASIKRTIKARVTKKWGRDEFTSGYFILGLWMKLCWTPGEIKRELEEMFWINVSASVIIKSRYQ